MYVKNITQEDFDTVRRFDDMWGRDVYDMIRDFEDFAGS